MNVLHCSLFLQLTLAQFGLRSSKRQLLKETCDECKAYSPIMLHTLIVSIANLFSNLFSNECKVYSPIMPPHTLIVIVVDLFSNPIFLSSGHFTSLFSKRPSEWVSFFGFCTHSIFDIFVTKHHHRHEASSYCFNLLPSLFLVFKQYLDWSGATGEYLRQSFF